MRHRPFFLACAALVFAAPALAGSRNEDAPLQAVSDAPDVLDNENTAPLTTRREDEKYAADTATTRVIEPGLSPKAPELERLAEREAQWMLWDQQLPATKAQLIDEAKHALEQGRGHAGAVACNAPKVSGSKEADALQGAMKRIKRLPPEERDPAKTELRACLDHAALPPSAPFPRAKPEPTRPRLSPAQQERCRFKGLIGC